MKKQKGVAMIIITLMMSLFLFLAMYMLDSTIKETKISKSQSAGLKTYYLAEAGISHMIWNIKNDPAFKNNFETDGSWSTTTISLNPFGPDSGRFEVTASNTSPAHSEIISIGYHEVAPGVVTQRVVKSYLYKAMGQSAIEDSAGFADNVTQINSSIVNFYNGSAHANNTFLVQNGSIVFSDSDIKAVNQYQEAGMGNVVTVLGAIYDSDSIPPPTLIIMPSIDFDSASSTSYKNIAIANGTYYADEASFRTLFIGDTLTLNEDVYYLDDKLELSKDESVIMSGSLLILEENFKIQDNGNCNTTNLQSIKINHASGTPSGIFSKKNITFGKCTKNVDVDGVIYSAQNLDIEGIDFNLNFDFHITGAIVSQHTKIQSCSEPINITHDGEIIKDTLPSASSSPTIIIDHWEEEY